MHVLGFRRSAREDGTEGPRKCDARSSEDDAEGEMTEGLPESTDEILYREGAGVEGWSETLNPAGGRASVNLCGT